VIWKGTITLLEEDMRRIGVALAGRFCEALRQTEKHKHDRYFEDEADALVVERAA
jgi:hypothetical protein